MSEIVGLRHVRGLTEGDHLILNLEDLVELNGLEPSTS